MVEIARRLAKRDPFTHGICDFCRVPWTPLERHIDDCLWFTTDTVVQLWAVQADETDVPKHSHQG